MLWENELNHPPLPHQIEAWEFAVAHHYSINAFQMGYGKSLIGIMLKISINARTLVVCPAFLKRNWEAEFTKFCKKPLKIRVLHSKDLKSFRPGGEDVLIINYEILGKAERLFAWAQFIIADESHYLANPTTKRTMAFAKFLERHRPERLLMLSGSPIRGKVPQWFAPIYIASLNPKKTSGIDIRKTPYSTHWAFQKMFCNEILMKIGGRRISKFEGLRNEAQLKKLLRRKYLRSVPSFKLELPPLFEKFVEVDYSNLSKALKEAWEEYEERKTLADHISSAKKESALSKVPYTAQYVSNIVEETGGPVVVYSDHVDPVSHLADMWRKKYEVGFITGAVPSEFRNNLVNKFQEGRLDILVATIGSASTGLTLTRANNLVFNDLSWINTENDQAKKRIHRIGQDKECAIHYIVGSDVDKMIAKTVTRKDEIMQRTVEI